MYTEDIQVKDAPVLKSRFVPLDEPVIVYPHTLSPLTFTSQETKNALSKILSEDKIICVFPEKNDKDGFPDTLFQKNDKIYSAIGTECRVIKHLSFPDGSIRVLVRGLQRIQVVALSEDNETVSYIHLKTVFNNEEKASEVLEQKALISNILQMFDTLCTHIQLPEELKIAVLNAENDERLIDLLADALDIPYDVKFAILSEIAFIERLKELFMTLTEKIEVLEIGKDIHLKVANGLNKHQREAFLREQLSVIKHELGDDAMPPEINALYERLSENEYPEEIAKLISTEIQRLLEINPASPEYNIACTYINWLLDLPWSIYTKDDFTIAKSRKILNADHYGLEKIKERILEFLAVLSLKEDNNSPILCFVGPPGVGKTSLGKSIAHAMDRNFIRMSLGGMRDEAEIRGHRRTYVGAMPGRILKGMKKAASNNPVFMLDEIDKIGKDFRGDPASALLEVLDPQQNNAFNDLYLEADYDLSSVLFIATANTLDSIPTPLLDRMEIIQLSAYTLFEKREIAKKYLIPRQLKDNGLAPKQISFPAKVLERIIDSYTREAGVRNLERTIGKICRKNALKIVEKQINLSDKIYLKISDLESYLGPERFTNDDANKKGEIGEAVGMAWTSVGGTTLNVEVTSMPGKSNLQLTGSLGDVMKESAQTAFSLIKSHAKDWNINYNLFKNNDFHIHVPDGATPKDGPSAGITIVTALVSHLTNTPVRPLTSMTGEITLRGKVTPVGGIKEKVIAALAAGIKNVILPAKNEKDLYDVPALVKDHLNFVFVDNVFDALDFLLIDKKKAK